MEASMHAIRVHEFGGPEMLRYEEVPRAESGPGEVLIRVEAAGVNPSECCKRTGFANIPGNLRPKNLVLPCTPGSDVSGIVAA
jgi:NADPH:quinone reductase-like Zn-dependent oxidoreductase